MTAATLAALYASRFAYGPLTGGANNPTAGNYQTWLGQQLAAKGDPAAIAQRLAAVNLVTTWNDASHVGHTDSGGLATLNLTDAQLYARYAAQPYDHRRPFDEVATAFWLRGLWSDYQLAETMTAFWHNHFAVDALSHPMIDATWPGYDRIMRTNALGNFRVLLGAVTKSVAMMKFLNLADSNKSHPNENFARELMELHTLGIDAYFGLTTPTGHAGQGYSDQDVIEAARVLTGWTLQNGQFWFNPNNHDIGNKTVLGTGFTNQGQLEGEALLDMLARHPATAWHIARKLYCRFVSDTVPSSSALLNALVSTFVATVNAPNQIAQLIQVIAQSPEFAASAGMKMKNPTEYTLSLLRMVGADVSVAKTAYFTSYTAMLGAPLFQWPQPNGAPDQATAWTGSAAMINRWRGAAEFVTPNAGYVQEAGLLTLTPKDPATGQPSLAQVPTFVRTLLAQIVPAASAATVNAVIAFANTTQILGDARTLKDPAQLRRAVGRVLDAIFSLPDFQLR